MPTLYTVPTPIDLLGELDAIKQIALDRVQVFETKNGTREWPMPDVNAAIRAVRCKAEICGYIRQQAQFETRDLMRDTLLRALRDPELRAVLVEGLREVEPGLLTATVETAKSGGDK